MYTSYYGALDKLPKNLRPVAISRQVPKWFTGAVEHRLAPAWKWLQMPREEYDRRFRKWLRRLDPWALYQELGDNAVLLCYEAPGKWCHRRLVAEWFENELGIVVPEWGFRRDETPPYDQLGSEPQQPQGPQQLGLDL